MDSATVNTEEWALRLNRDLIDARSRIAALEEENARLKAETIASTISEVFYTVGECLAGMTHDQVSETARRKIEAAIDAAARRVREGGKVDG